MIVVAGEALIDLIPRVPETETEPEPGAAVVAGNTEVSQATCNALFGALASGNADRWKSFAESCLAEYNLDGWLAPDLVNADDVSILKRDRR